jgi:hypothetical protein
MILWEIIDKRSQKTFRDVFNEALIIILIICFDGIFNILKMFFFPSGNLAIEITIILGDLCAIFLMAHLVIMVIFERINESIKEIKKMKTQTHKRS